MAIISKEVFHENNKEDSYDNKEKMKNIYVENHKNIFLYKWQNL